MAVHISFSYIYISSPIFLLTFKKNKKRKVVLRLSHLFGFVRWHDSWSSKKTSVEITHFRHFGYTVAFVHDYDVTLFFFLSFLRVLVCEEIDIFSLCIETTSFSYFIQSKRNWNEFSFFLIFFSNRKQIKSNMVGLIIIMWTDFWLWVCVCVNGAVSSFAFLGIGQQ